MSLHIGLSNPMTVPSGASPRALREVLITATAIATTAITTTAAIATTMTNIVESDSVAPESLLESTPTSEEAAALGPIVGVRVTSCQDLAVDTDEVDVVCGEEVGGKEVGGCNVGNAVVSRGEIEVAVEAVLCIVLDDAVIDGAAEVVATALWSLVGLDVDIREVHDVDESTRSVGWDVVGAPVVGRVVGVFDVGAAEVGLAVLGAGVDGSSVGCTLGARERAADGDLEGVLVGLDDGHSKAESTLAKLEIQLAIITNASLTVIRKLEPPNPDSGSPKPHSDDSDPA